MADEREELDLWEEEGEAEESPADNPEAMEAEADNELDRLLDQRESGDEAEEVDEPEPDEPEEDESEDEPQEEQDEAPEGEMQVDTGDPRAYWKQRYNAVRERILAKELEDEGVKYDFEHTPGIRRSLEMQVDNTAMQIIQNEINQERAAGENDVAGQKYMNDRFGEAWHGLHESEDFAKWVRTKPSYVRKVVIDNMDRFTDVESIADVIEQYLGEQNTGGDVPNTGGNGRRSGSVQRPAQRRTLRQTPGPSQKRATRTKLATDFDAAVASDDPDEIIMAWSREDKDSPLHGAW